MLDAALLQTVATVVREGSFERAAQVLHVSPSAVSQRVRQIEDRLGLVLIQRGQPCQATEAGARLCRHAETVALLEQDLRRSLPGLPDDPAGQAPSPLRIALNADSLATWFVTALSSFTAEEPQVLIDLSVADQDHTSGWLQRGQVLGAVTSLAAPVAGCRSRRLGALRYVATASPAFMARWFAGGVTPDALQRAPSLRFDPQDQLQAQWVRRLWRRALALPAHRLPSSQAFVAAALAGVGWGMNPLPLVQAALDDGRLVELVPGRHLDVPLYWQVAQLPIPPLERFSRHLMAAATAALR